MPIAVVRAETYYLPPRSLGPHAWDDVPGAELIWRWMEYRMERRLDPPVDPVEQIYFARINQNRWIVDCICGSAQISSPVDQRAACTECGWGWAVVIYPEDVPAVESPLLPLPPSRRNWWNPVDPNNPDAPPPPVEEQP